MTVLERVPMDRITTEAAQIAAGRTMLTLLAGAFYGLGWLLAKTVRLVLTALTVALYGVGRGLGWAFVAMRVGWMDATAGGGRRGAA